VTVDGIALAAHPEIHIVNARAEIGGAFAAGGGCSTAPTAGPALTTGLFFALVAAAALGATARRPRKSRRARPRRTLDS